ncbi:hypothetical protein BN1723_020761, partial [Verticillium longisporum]
RCREGPLPCPQDQEQHPQVRSHLPQQLHRQGRCP